MLKYEGKLFENNLFVCLGAGEALWSNGNEAGQQNIFGYHNSP